MADIATRLDAATCLIGDAVFTPPGDRIDVISPWTEQPIGSFVDAGPQFVNRAVTAAAEAARDWRRTDPARRAALLDAVADLLEQDGEEIARLVSSEMGMPIALARATQSVLPATVLRATAALVRDFAWEEETSTARLLRTGAGVVGAITPWNMPVHQIVAKVASAVGAGCSVVLKPSEQTPYDAALLAGMFLRAGAPAGLLNIVTGSGDTGAALASHPGLARMSFTGSVGAGKAVARAAAWNLTPCTLELGGKSPAVLLPDVDLDLVLPRVLESGLINSGQACNATTRLVIPTTLVAEVEDRLPTLIAALTMGDPADEATRQGPLVSSGQRDRVLDYVAGAVAGGGRLVTGTGRPAESQPHGWFVDPVVIAGLDRDATAVQEEIFGPVLVIQPYETMDEAIDLANDTRYGLSAEVWSRDAERALDVARHLRAGQVKVNGVRTRERPTVPFGGIGDSGYGRELGEHGILDFTDLTAVMA